MITNQDITVFNVRIDKKNRREVFVPTNISGVSYHSTRASSGSPGEMTENLTFKIRIPLDAKIGGKRIYIPEEQYKNLDDSEALKHWTIQKGCIILLGTVFQAGEWIFDEFNFRSGYITEEQMSDIQAVRNYNGDFITVVEYADNTLRGSDRVKHWRIGGA